MSSTQHLAHRLAILDALGRYAHAADGLRFDAWAGIFTEDGCLELYGPHDERPYVVVEGRELIRLHVERQQAHHGGYQTRHLQTNTVFLELGDHRAQTASEFVLTIKATDAEPKLLATGVYEDRWRRTSSGWRIERRSVRAD
jgi:3-phenylpropionate/cinnamic acid dioxygenase small subunit